MSDYLEPRGEIQDQDLIPVPVHIASSGAEPTREIAPEYSACMSWSVDTLANMGNGRPVRLLPRRYRRKEARIYISSLGALGTQASGEGSVTSPGASAPIASIAIGGIANGEYLINWAVSLDGTVSATDVNNFRLQQNPGGVTLENSTNDGVVGRYPQNQFGPVSLTTANGLRVVSIAAGTVGAVYSAQINIIPVVPNETANLLLASNEPQLMNNQGALFYTSPMVVVWKGQQPCYACLQVGSTGGPVIISVIDEAYEES